MTPRTKKKTRHYKPPSERKTFVIPIRCTKEQRDRYARAANIAQRTVSDWLRELADKASA